MQRSSGTILIDSHSGVPLYRQIVDQVKVAIGSGSLSAGDQLPTVRRLAVDLSINPNTVARAYRELELAGLLTTQQGSGTFVSTSQPATDSLELQRRLDRIITEMLARASSLGFSLDEIAAALRERQEGT